MHVIRSAPHGVGVSPKPFPGIPAPERMLTPGNLPSPPRWWLPAIHVSVAQLPASAFIYFFPSHFAANAYTFKREAAHDSDEGRLASGSCGSRVRFLQAGQHDVYCMQGPLRHLGDGQACIRMRGKAPGRSLSAALLGIERVGF